MQPSLAWLDTTAKFDQFELTLINNAFDSRNGAFVSHSSENILE